MGCGTKHKGKMAKGGKVKGNPFAEGMDMGMEMPMPKKAKKKPAKKK